MLRGADRSIGLPTLGASAAPSRAFPRGSVRRGKWGEPLGGLRGLVHARAILGNIRVLVLPDQVAVSKAGEAFNPDGSLKDPKQRAAVEALGAKLAQMISKIHP